MWTLARRRTSFAVGFCLEQGLSCNSVVVSPQCFGKACFDLVGAWEGNGRVDAVIEGAVFCDKRAVIAEGFSVVDCRAGWCLMRTSCLF